MRFLKVIAIVMIAASAHAQTTRDAFGPVGAPAIELGSELTGVEDGEGEGVVGEVGIAGDVILSRAFGSCAASGGGVGVVVESIVSRYGSTSPYDSGKGVCGW